MPTSNDELRPSDSANKAVLPLLAEEVAVSKQVVETGRVQVARVTHEREQLIDELLAHETAEIERTPIGRQVDVMPAVREEGDAIVVSDCRGSARYRASPLPQGRGAHSAGAIHGETPGDRDPPASRSGGHARSGGGASSRGESRIWRAGAAVQPGVRS